MLEFIELKVSLHAIKTAKEVKMYFIYMALGFFAHNTTEHKVYGTDFARTKIHGKVHNRNFGSFFGVWQIMKAHLSVACVGSFY